MAKITNDTVPVGATSAEVTTPTTRSSGRIAHALEAYTLAAFVLGFTVFLSFLPSTSEPFTNVAIFQAVLGNQAVAGIVTLAALIPLIGKQFDLSVGASSGRAGIYTADAVANGTAVRVAVLIGIGIGVIVGTINSVLVTCFGLNDVVATLGTSTLIAGLITMKTGGQPISRSPTASSRSGRPTRWGSRVRPSCSSASRSSSTTSSNTRLQAGSSTPSDRTPRRHGSSGSPRDSRWVGASSRRARCPQRLASCR